MILDIPGDPIAKARHRSFLRNGKVMIYDIQDGEKTSVKNFLALSVNKKLYSTNHLDIIEINKIIKSKAFSIDFIFYLPFPKTDMLIRQNRTSWGMDYMTDKPDIDNLIKFYLDCANGILYQDDKQIVEISASKVYSSKPRTVMNITPKPKIDLDPKAEKILEIISHSQFIEFLEAINELHLFTSDLDAENISPSSETNIEIYKKRLARTASILSELSELYLPYLKKINKYCPNYYLEYKEEPYTHGKTIS